MHIAAADPFSLDIEGLDKKVIDKERSIYFEQLKSSGKPENILEKIVEGKLNKFYSDVCLLDQIFVIDNKTPVRKCIETFNTENSSNFKIKNFIVYKLGQN